MVELHLAPSGLYSVIKEDDDENADWDRPTKTDDNPRIPMDVAKFSELGAGFSTLVLTAVERNIITRADAAEYLDVPEARLDKFTQRVVDFTLRYG
jgi:hypothetical protein